MASLKNQTQAPTDQTQAPAPTDQTVDQVIATGEVGGASGPTTFEGESATVADIGDAGTFLTQSQAMATMNAGLSVVSAGGGIQGDRAFVVLTDAGKAALHPAPTPAPTAPKTKPTFTITSAVALPPQRGRGRGKSGSMYPFDELEVGQSFHIPKTAENPDPAGLVASSVAGARMKHAVPVNNPDGTPKMEDHVVKTYQKTPDGKAFVKDAEGKRVVMSETTEQRQVKEYTRDFMVWTVDESDPEGEGARVGRSK